MDDVFSFLDPNNKEQCLLVMPAGTSAGIDSLGFIVGDTMVRKGVILPLSAVTELRSALGKFLGVAFAPEPAPGAPRVILNEHGDSAEELRSELQSRVNILWATPNPTLCPLRVQSSLEAYVRGLPPGDFIRAVLENDLNGAITRADDVNIHALPHIVAYVREHLPAVSCGSKANVDRWLKLKAKQRKEEPEREAPPFALEAEDPDETREIDQQTSGRWER